MNVCCHVLVILGASCALMSEAQAGDETILPPAALAETPLPGNAHPLHRQINAFMARAADRENFTPTRLNRRDYLRVIDGQVRVMQRYQNARGGIVDPVRHEEVYYATPCYAHCVAALLASGFRRDSDLLESGMRAMDAALSDMVAATAKNNHGDFYTYPAMMALELFDGLAPPQRVAAWRKDLGRLNSEKLYRSGAGGSNWNVVNLSGEYLRAVHGLTNMDYVEESLTAQLKHFTPLGMYDEHGHPLAYDQFPRHFLAGILVGPACRAGPVPPGRRDLLGYRGPSYAAYRELLWRGAWTSLLMQSPFGELPTGFRSSHHIWNEAASAVTFEVYATHYARAGRDIEAGAMKRAARLSLACIQRWIRPDGSGYIVKNRFPIEAEHGYESYSAHANYNMLACSMLSAAWAFADDAVQEGPCPAEIGGFVLPILDPFHKVFANAGGAYIEYDTCGDHIYNPTGLIRVHIEGGHPQLGPSDGCAPKFSGAGVNLSIGPAWKDSGGKWHRLADTSPAPPSIDVLEESPTRVRFRVAYASLESGGAAEVTSSPQPLPAVTQTFTLERKSVTVEDELTGGDVQRMRVYYPMLVFDGLERTQVTLDGPAVSLKLAGRGILFEILKPQGVRLQRTGELLTHRNGMTEPAFGEWSGRRAEYRIRVP